MKRLFPCKIWKRGTAWVLAFSILFQTMAVSAHETVIGSSEGYSEQTEAVVTEGADPSETQPSSDADETNPTVSEEEQTPSEQAFPEADSSTTAPQDPASQEQTQEEPKNITEIYENGVIKIYNLRQLQSIGTGLAVRAYDMHEEQFGTGEEVLAKGQAITYSSDAAYMLMNEIALPSENIWTLPEGFTGTFAGTPAEDAVLYAKESDTVYVYNNYQLRLIASENSAEEPMMSSDMIPEKVGMGQLLYKDGTPAGESLDEAQEYLTYSKEHNYVLSPSFTEQMPELLSEQYVQTSADEVQKGGRDYIGQSYTTIEGEKYILIGNEQQLRAIGSDKRVTPMLFLRTEAGLLIKRIHIVPYYPGDADFNMDSFLDTGISYQPGDIETGSENFQYKYQSDEAKKKELMNIDWGSDTLLGDVVDIVGRLLGGLLGTLFGSQELVGLTVDGNNTPSIGAGKPWGANGEYTPFRDLEREYKDLKYSSDANYIIFRDIDLLQGEYSNGEDDNWTPIHFSGKMEGRLNMQADVSPTIKNIHVEQTGKLNMETTSGIGFFGTISNKLDENTLGSAGTAVVKNMHLEEVSVTNKSTEVDNNVDSLVEGVLGLLGGLVGGLLEGLGALLPIIGDLKLGDVIRDLLTLKQKSPDLFATGSFAGRIVGDVHVENCTVDKVSVTSARGISGGFVGFTEGVETYDGLSGLLGTVVKVLSTLLNIVPGVGLGDLITVLLQNDVPLGNLIPTGYHNPVIAGCSVTLKNEIIGNATQDYNGGFVGIQTGTRISNSSVSGLTTVQAKNGAGGFAGLERDAIIKGLLNDAGITLYEIDAKSRQEKCAVNGQNLVIETTESYAGGFNGASVPCGGAVRADGLTDTQCVRGLAGGYVGYNHGGRILGNATEGGKECAAVRIRSVYGGEFAGGFTGLMETADLAGTGNLELLFGLLKTSNVLSLLGAVYPTETNTAVYGPLRKVDMDTWNKWAEAVGSNGVYGDQFPSTPVTTEEELQSLIQQYAYGYNVKAGRTNVGTQDMEAGVAGGYVGRMKAGVVTNAHAWDAKFVSAYTSAGGFAGEMKTGGVAEVGKVSLIGLDITGSISAVQTFVPVIRNSDITGFQSGMTVKATGIPVKDSTLKIEKVGYAGGYVGHMLGGQIWGNWSEASTYGATDAVPDPNNKRCFVANLRKVEGTKTIGGFAGQIDPASAAALDTAGSSGLLGGLLQSLIKTPGDLLSLLNTTVSTVRGADVDAWDKWGIIVNGAYANGSGNTAYAKAAGGFAGEINGAVIGEMNTPDSGVHVSNIRSVTGGEYVGGFLGLADVSAVAQVSDGGNTNILAELLKLGGTSALDAFRTFVYASDVSGAAEAGLEVRARDSKKTEYVNDPVYSGSAGGFGGALLNGSVKDSKVTNLRKVNGMNYTGGFIGHLGKSGTVDLDNLGALGKLLSAGAGVMDIFGSHVDRCSVSGVTEGFTVHSDNTIDKQDKSEIAGGFTGYADLGRMTGNEVTGLKQVTSNQIAGGYAGKTNFAYLVDIKVNSDLVKYLVQAVNQILKALQLDNLQKGDVIKIDLGIIKINALYDGELVALNLLGLDIKVGLAKDKSLATIYIGDSKIEINCSEGGTIDEESLKNEINISLIKANRTRIDSCTVTGVKEGYDVYGGGAGNNGNGTGEYGIAGGFIGWNNEGLFRNNKMFLADVVRGAKDLTGPFTGKASLKSNWDFNDIVGIEGDENYYQIYRQGDMVYNDLLGSSGAHLEERHDQWDSWKNIYTIRHMTENKVVKFKDLKDALMGNGTAKEPVNVYQEDGAMAVLMNNTASSPTEPGGSEAEPDVQDPCKDLIELRIKKVWKGDDEKDRPNEVIFHVTRSYVVNGETFKDETFKEEVILTKEDAQTSDTWEKVLSGEKFTAYHEGVDGKKYHYTYHISETKVDGYETTVTYQGDHQYNITVTNKKNWFDSLLPETGGLGTALLYTLGVLLLCFVTTTGYKKSKRRQGGYK